jgi:hypothetical protein
MWDLPVISANPDVMLYCVLRQPAGFLPFLLPDGGFTIESYGVMRL